MLRSVCTGCGHIHYGQLIIGAGCLVESERRLLLIRRSNKPFQGSWCLPAGHVDDNEPPSMAAQRETLEETGLEVTVGPLVDAYFSDDHPAGCGVFLVYKCVVLAGSLRETDEGLTPTFFRQDQIPAHLAGGGHRAAIEAWVNRTPEPTQMPLSLHRQLSIVWNARYQQDQVLWRIFAAFWPTNAILLAALFRSPGQSLPPQIGAITAGCGVLVGVVWFLIQRRALGHVMRIESTAERIERVLLNPSQSVYALSTSLNVADSDKIGGVAARTLIPLCAVIVSVLWLLGFIYFFKQLFQ